MVFVAYGPMIKLTIFLVFHSHYNFQSKHEEEILGGGWIDYWSEMLWIRTYGVVLSLSD